MAFFSILLFWPLFLAAWLLSLLSLALPVIAVMLLIWNAIIFMFLLAVRHAWKKTGTMDRGYIDAQTGWKHALFLILRWGLTLLIIWEILLIIGSGCLLSFGTTWLASL